MQKVILTEDTQRPFFKALCTMRRIMDLRTYEVEYLHASWPALLQEAHNPDKDSYAKLRRRLAKQKDIAWLATLPDGESIVAVIFLEDPSLGVSTVRLLESILSKQKERGKQVKHVIFVTQKDVTSVAKKELAELQDYEVETFMYKDIQSYICDNVAVPQYKVVPQDEALSMIQGNNMRTLPASDIAARFYGMKEGTVVSYMRTFPSTQPHLTFRQVRCM